MEPWLEVVVKGAQRVTENQRKQGDRESGLTIRVTQIQRGTLEGDAQAYTINFNNRAMPFPSPKRAGELDPIDVDATFRSGRPVEAEFSYVPATAENIAALADLQDRLAGVADQLSTFLRQDAVNKSLAHVATVRSANLLLTLGSSQGGHNG